MLDNSGANTSNLYRAQIWSNLLFDFAFRKGDLDILEQLAELYLIPLNHLEQHDSYWFYRGGSTRPPYTKRMLNRIPGGRDTFPMWTKEIEIKWKQNGVDKQKIIPLEIILHSSQYLYLMAHALHAFVSLEGIDVHRHPNIHDFIQRYPAVIKDHYDRWIFASNDPAAGSDLLGIFQTIGWGCDRVNRFSHRQFLEKKLNKSFTGASTAVTFCNAVRDEDMWILCGAVEMLAAHGKNNPRFTLFTLEPEEKNRYQDYFSIGCRIIRDRLVPTDLRDFDNKKVKGFNFDPNVWRTHNDWKHSGHQSAGFPPAVPNRQPPEGISWDISHARRFVQVFETLHRNRRVTRQAFPSRKIMTGLANQAAFKVFQGSFERPLFKNFFNGTNGWYRVGYKGSGFGFGPGNLSVEWLSGGMPSWYHYQPQMERINNAVWSMLDSQENETQTFKHEKYSHPHFENSQPTFKNMLDTEKRPYILNYIAASAMPPVPFTPSGLELDHEFLNFGAREGADETLSRQLFVSGSGEEPLCWSAASDTPWLSFSPDSGAGDTEVTLSVNPKHLRFGRYRGRVTFRNIDDDSVIKTVTITLKVFRRWKALKPFGSFDTPNHNSRVSGSIPVTGWALHKIGVEHIKIYRKPLQGEGRKPLFIGNAVFSEGTRKDVAALHPEHPGSDSAGWGYMLLTNALPNQGNGTFTLVAKAFGANGREQVLGEKTIHCNNADSVKPFGAIDSPVPNQTVSGKIRIQGWVLTPPPAKIPEDGSTIQVFVDGKHIGHARYNIPRDDIHHMFPQCQNSRQSLALFDLDTTKLKNGIHQLQWSVRDNNGHVAGIGSRFFKVRNKSL